MLFEMHVKMKYIIWGTISYCSLSQYVTDAEQSARLVSLLVPFLTHNINRSQDLEVSILKSVQNLLKQVPQPADFME